PAVTLGVGVGLVARVDDGPAAGGGRRHALPYVLGSLADAVHGAAGGLQHLPGPGVDLARHEERDQYLGIVREVVSPAGQIVLVAAVRIPSRIGVVFKKE